MPVTDQAIINFAALETATVNQQPFPFLIVPDFLRREAADQVARDFPKIDFAGSIPVNVLECTPVFRRFIEELEGDSLRSAIEKKFNVDLQNRPTFITLRSKTRAKDGRIHTDTKSKLITLLLYLNPEWESDAGKLRVLRDGENLENYVAEIPPTLGHCLIFKVTDNCWHGHKPFEGERRAIQLNYLTNEAALKQHLSKHNLSAKWKSWKKWFSRGDEY
jgi:SM-20-related protein